MQIGQRRNDGYINGTALCVAHNKDISDWLKTDDAWDMVIALADDLGIEPKCPKSGNSVYTRVSATYPTLVVVKRGSPETGGGTWVHPDLVVYLAQWCNKPFAIQVSRWVREWLTTGQNPIAQPQPQPQIQPHSEIPELLAVLENLEHDILVSLSHYHAMHNVVEQPITDTSLNKVIHTSVHEQGKKLNAALAKLNSIRDAILALQTFAETVNQFQSISVTFNQLTQIIEQLRQENSNLKQTLAQQKALLTASAKNPTPQINPEAGTLEVPSLERVLSGRIKQLTAMQMATEKQTGGQRAMKTCTLRATILARYQFGESLENIAADLEPSYQTVKTYVKLARRSIQVHS